MVEIAAQLPELTPPLAVWPISGNTTRVKNFQVRRQTSCCHHGDRSQHNPMTHCVRNGSAGVLNGKQIPIEDVVNFLAYLHNVGYQYRSLNSYRSAIASMHTPIEGVSIGQHPLGAFQACPPLPRYTVTWNVNQVLEYLRERPLDWSTSLKHLSLRT